MANPTYASGNFRMGWNGAILTGGMNTGWGDDQFMAITPNGDLVETAIGADGHMSVSQLADQGGVIEVTFKQTAEALNKIDLVAATQQLMNEIYTGPFLGMFTFEDPLGNVPNFVAWNTVLVNKGAQTHQKVMGERTVTWHCEKLIFGSVDEIKPKILDYIK